jgi:hypothetical protein
MGIIGVLGKDGTVKYPIDVSYDMGPAAKSKENDI